MNGIFWSLTTQQWMEIGISLLILLGVLLLAKDIEKDKLEQRKEGAEIIKGLEEAEDTFVNNSLTDGYERMEDILDVIQKRTKALFMFMEYISH